MAFDLSERQAAMYISLRIAHGDHVLQKEEKDVISSYYDLNQGQALMDAIKKEGIALEQVDLMAIKKLKEGDPQDALKALAIGAKVAGVDHKIDHTETGLLVRFATDLQLDLSTVLNYLK